MAKLTINNGLLQAAIEQQLKKAVLRFAFLSTAAITSNRDWGEPWGTRDVVDLGGLKGSQRIDRISATEYRLFYTVSYALPVHEGITKKDQTKIPGRPFLKIAKEELLREIGQR